MLQFVRKSLNSLMAATMVAFGMFTFVACEPRSETVDERQATVTKANTNLARIEALMAELKTAGVQLEAQAATSDVILFHREPALKSTKANLEEFVAAADSVLETSKRTDVMWAGRDDLILRLKNARFYLMQVNARFAKPDAELGPRFWEIRDSCIQALSNGVEVDGVRWHQSDSFDENQIRKLSHERRLELAKRIREQIDCDVIVQRSYRAQFGDTRPVSPPAGAKFEPLIKKLETENR